MLLTNSELKEFNKCKNDIEYFAEKYFYISTSQFTDKIKLKDHQKKIFKHIDDNLFSAIVAPRQSYKTTTILIYALHQALFNKYKSIIVTGINSQNVQMLYEELHFAAKRLPSFFGNFQIKKFASITLSFENGSTIHFYNQLVCNRIGFSQYPDIYISDEEAYCNTSYSQSFFEKLVENKTKCIFISSPKFNSDFNKVVQTSLDNKVLLKSLIIPWNFTPERNDEWKEKMIYEIGSDRFKEEYDPECQFNMPKKTFNINDIFKSLDEPCRPYLYSIQIDGIDDKFALTASSRKVEIVDKKLILEFILTKTIWKFIKSNEYKFVTVNALSLDCNEIVATSKIFIKQDTKEMSFIKFSQEASDSPATFKVTYDIIRQEAI